MNTYYVKRGDVGSFVPETLLAPSGVGAVLTSATVRFIMRAPGASEPTVADDAEIIDAELGQVKYVWKDGDLDSPGFYRAEWEVTYSNETVEHFPSNGYISVWVRADLDAEAASS